MSKDGLDLSLSTEKVAVVGASGFIGQALVEALVLRRCYVNAFGRDWTDNRCSSSSLVSYFSGDAAQEADLRPALRGCTVVYYLAYDGVPLLDSTDHIKEYELNIRMFCSTLAAAEYGGAERVVFVSSGGTVYGPVKGLPIDEEVELAPISHYGAVKKLQEGLLHSYCSLSGSLKYVTARVANPFGLGQVTAKRKGLIMTYMLAALRTQPVSIFGDGSQVRDYIYIDDAIDALILLGTRPQAINQVYNVGSGNGDSIAMIADLVEKVSGMKLQRRFVDGRKQDVHENQLSIKKIHEDLGWAPEHEIGATLSQMWETISDRWVDGRLDRRR